MNKKWKLFIAKSLVLILILTQLQMPVYASDANKMEEITAEQLEVETSEVRTETWNESEITSECEEDSQETAETQTESETERENESISEQETETETEETVIETEIETETDSETGTDEIIETEEEEIVYDASTRAISSPDNSFDTATKINTNTTYTDNLASSSDVNYYKFTTSSNGYVSISFSHGYVDSSSDYWIVTLYDETQTKMISKGYDGNYTGTITTANVGIPAGTYYVKVEDGNYSEKDYSLKVNYVSSAVWETEFNNDFDTADSISVGTGVTGSVMNSSDVDYYKFTTSANGYASISFSHGYVDSSWDYWIVTVYNDDKTVLFSRGFDGNTEATITTVTVGIPLGTYYVKVEDGNYSDLDYKLKVNYTSSSLWETETNNIFDTADVIRVGTAVNGSIMQNSDIDCYKFEVESDGYISISFSHGFVDSNWDYWTVTLYDNAKTEIINRGFDGNTMETVTTTNVGLPAGTYFIKVEDGNFSDLSYKLTVNYTSSSTWETEFNDSFRIADDMNVGKVMHGSLMKAGDEDYYKLQIQKGDYFNLSFVHAYVESSWSYWNVTVYDANMSQIGKYSYAGNVTNKKEAKQYLNAGTYYIKVEDGNYSDGDYSISMFSSTFANSKPVLESVANYWEGIEVTWKELPYAEGYYIYRKTGSGKWKQIGQVEGGDVLSYVDTTVESGVTYFYTVKGYAGSVVSKYNTNGKKIKRLMGTTVEKENAATGIKVTWNKVKGAEGYYIYRTIKGDVEKRIAKVEGGNKVSYVDKKVTAGTGYTYSVIAYAGKSLGYDLSDNLIYVWDDNIYYIEQPKIKKVENVTSGISVTWSECECATDYMVYRKCGTEDWVELAEVTGSGYIDSTALDGVLYSYNVKAEMKYYDGFMLGAPSSQFSKESPTKTIKRMIEPDNISATNVVGGTKITWDTTSSAKGYYVYRKAEGGTWKKVGTITQGTKNSYTDKTAKSGQTYYYTVKAYVGNVTSSKDEYGESVLYIAAPVLSSLNKNKTQITFKWSKVAGATGYYVYRKSGNGDWAKVATVKDANTYIDTNIVKGTKYTYTVEAYSGSVISGRRSGGLSIKY